jgi:hypothetical protein
MYRSRRDAWKGSRLVQSLDSCEVCDPRPSTSAVGWDWAWA